MTTYRLTALHDIDVRAGMVLDVEMDLHTGRVMLVPYEPAAAKGPEPGRPTNEQEALARGWAVDRCVYPWVAYRGSRFMPDDWTYIDTPARSETTDG